MYFSMCSCICGFLSYVLGLCTHYLPEYDCHFYLCLRKQRNYNTLFKVLWIFNKRDLNSYSLTRNCNLLAVH